MLKSNVKTKLLSSLAEKMEMIQVQMNDLRGDLLSESKSTSGDKHETGRAMIQREMESLGGVHSTALEGIQFCQKLSTEKHEKVQAGSLVKMNGDWYYFSVSFGKMEIDEQVVICLSTSSPLGQICLGKKQGESFDFLQKTWKIDEVN